jgi:hypothetical protein
MGEVYCSLVLELTGSSPIGECMAGFHPALRKTLPNSIWVGLILDPLRGIGGRAEVIFYYNEFVGVAKKPAWFPLNIPI